MRICLMIEGQEGVSWNDWVALARLTEKSGLEGLFRSDHYSSIFRSEGDAAHDAWTTIAGLGALTGRIRLGTLVSPATFRHPSVVARSVATADHISGGRVELGLGAGWYEREHLQCGFPFRDAGWRFQRFAEHVEIVVRSWTEDRFDFEGSHHTLRDARALPKPMQQPHPPVILGGTAKPHSAALAARFASEYNTSFATVEQCRERRAALDLACNEAGRDPATLVFSLMTGCIVGEDRGQVLGRVGRVLGRMGDRADPAQAIEERRDVWLVGTVEEVAERIEVLRTAGIERVFLQHLDHTDAEMIELIGRRLLPAVG